MTKYPDYFGKHRYKAVLLKEQSKLLPNCRSGQIGPGSMSRHRLMMTKTRLGSPYH